MDLRGVKNKMNFIRPNLFDFAKNSTLKSKFKGIKQITKDLGIQFNETQIQSLNPQVLFEQLIKGKMDLDLIQVFSLMGWENHQWTSQNGKIAMRNWWLSALDKAQQGELIFRHIMVLRTILADTERYPAPKDVIKTMRIGLDNLIASGEWKDDKYVDVLQALVSQNAKKLAEIAFKQNKSVLQLIKEAGFPRKLPIIEEAELLWLKLWLNTDITQRQKTSAALNQLLHTQSSLDQQQKFAVFILNEAIFVKPFAQLKQIVANYPEIVHWFSICDRDNDFRKSLELEEIQRLNCWVGSGNYQSLRALLIDITRYESLESSAIELTENRYIFWNNYQHLFRESWLFVSQYTYDRHPDIKRLKNVKIISGFSKPIILIRIGQYYLLQMFIVRGTEVDFIMINDTEKVEQLLYQSIISYTAITQLSICLLHDHLYKWQADLAYTLDRNFSIQPSGSIIDITQTLSRNYLQETSNFSFKSERNEPVKSWLRNARQRWTNQQLQQTAFTAKRYNLI